MEIIHLFLYFPDSVHQAVLLAAQPIHRGQ